MKLTSEQLDRFERDGYLFFPGLFTPDEIKVLSDEAGRLRQPQLPNRMLCRGMLAGN